MKILTLCLLGLSAVCSAQVAAITDIATASGFVETCGRKPGTYSKEQAETIKNAPPSQVLEAMTKALHDSASEGMMCLGFVAGLHMGWEEGHEHGVVAAQFPDGWPKDEKKALAALPLKQLQAATTAMKVDVPCIPDYVTVGQERDIIVKYIREQEKTNPFMSLALTSRMAYLAFQETFFCPTQSTKAPDPAK
jgi:hypothetical protein